jgi:hypothetical protein
MITQIKAGVLTRQPVENLGFSPPSRTNGGLIWDFTVPDDIIDNIQYVELQCNGAVIYRITPKSSPFNFEIRVPVTYGQLYIYIKLTRAMLFQWLDMSHEPCDFGGYDGKNIGTERDIIVRKDEYGEFYTTDIIQGNNTVYSGKIYLLGLYIGKMILHKTTKIA